jgi:hypothetical protein
MKKILIFLLCFLAPLTDLKLGSVQPVEMLMFVLLPVVIYKIFSTLEIKSSFEAISLLRKYIFLILLIVLLSFFSLRLNVFLPAEVTFFKTPPYLSFAKLFQFVVVVMTMFVLIFLFIKNPKLINFFAFVYTYAGLFSAFFALLSFVAMFAGIELGGAYGIQSPRAKGFFVEGGPFGLYIVSVLLVVMFRSNVLGDGTKFESYVQVIILVAALFASSSKAGILLAILLLIYFQIISGKFKRVFFVAVVMVPLFLVTGKLDGIVGYVTNYNDFTNVAMERSSDNNLVMGRIMASVLVPRMLMDHPLSGIGLGNYSLQRNNPDYLQGLPTTEYWDLPGLGLFGYAAELGLPLIFLLIWILWRPVNMMRKRKSSPILIILASYHFFAFLFGVQITFLYPWLIAALALGYSYRRELPKCQDPPGYKHV